MNILFMSILLIVGFVLLIKGADIFVDGASSLSNRFGIPSVIIGLTVVAFGTSLPEASVSITASLSGSEGISFGNVIGSNIFNLLVVLGASAIFKPVPVNRDIIKKDFPFSIIITVATLFLGYNIFVSTTGDMMFTRADGVVLLILFSIFMYYTISSAKSSKTKSDKKCETLPKWKEILFIVLGIAAIYFGGEFVVKSASYFAKILGLTESLIGLTIVALGTSLPELVTSIVASKKGENDIAVGNVVGSNIFNILFVLGFATVIKDMSIDINGMFDIIILTVSSIAVYFTVLKKKHISRAIGITMIIAYVAYLIYIIYR